MPKKKIILPHFILILELISGGKSDVSPLLKIVANHQIRGAVRRNRVKRVIREFFRQKRGLLRGKSVICIARPGAGEIENVKLFQELNKAL